MAGKITEYTNETNEAGILDLLDISKEIGGSYESQRLKRDAINNELIFSGGATIFKGENSVNTDYSFKSTNLSNASEMSMRNDGVFQTGLTNLTNYLRQEVNRTVQYSTTASQTRFICDRGGSHKVALGSGSSLGTLQFTSSFAITSWTGSETGSGINDYYVNITGSTWHFGQNAGSGLDGLIVNMQRYGNATGTGDQSNSAKMQFTNGLWDGASNIEKFELQSVANISVNSESSLDFSQEGTDLLRLRNDGYLRQRAIDAVLPDADLNNSEMSFYIDETGNTLNVKVKYAGGTVKTAIIGALA